MARPTKRTPEVVAGLVAALEVGATIKIACMSVGIADKQFYAWQAAFSEFRDTVKAAEAKGALKWLGHIEKAANEGEWTAAAWKLERRYPNDYGKRLPEMAADGEMPMTRVVIVEDRRAALPAPTTEPDD